FRTQKLSPPAPMVLRKWESRSPPVFIFEKPLAVMLEAFLFGYEVLRKEECCLIRRRLGVA
ncbi:hypothetical protein JSO53_05115, partial [Riemerella anatipestifer]|nr:hypothetical protein [Riemerella anatipestifer]MDY3541779.1 hypothetical protein [Riemerella anatipestifer]MRN04760.1 hypothetical protein [Riemerella anatipestifer]